MNQFVLLAVVVVAYLSVVCSYSYNSKVSFAVRSKNTIASIKKASSVINRNHIHSHNCNCICKLCTTTANTVLFANKLDGITFEGDLTPLSNNILIKVKEAAIETKGGLFIPDNAKERPTEGVCVAAGPGRIHPETALQLDMSVKAGDGVIYGKYDGTELKYNDLNHQMIKDDDVLLIYSGKEPTLANVQPIKDQILIELPPKEEANLSGIIITTASAKEKKLDHGIVAKVGTGRQAGNGKYMQVQVQPGDSVRFRSFAGSEVKIEGKEYIVVRTYDILAKWKA